MHCNCIAKMIIDNKQDRNIYIYLEFLLVAEFFWHVVSWTLLDLGLSNLSAEFSSTFLSSLPSSLSVSFSFMSANFLVCQKLSISRQDSCRWYIQSCLFNSAVQCCIVCSSQLCHHAQRGGFQISHIPFSVTLAFKIILCWLKLNLTQLRPTTFVYYTEKSVKCANKCLRIFAAHNFKRKKCKTILHVCTRRTNPDDGCNNVI